MLFQAKSRPRVRIVDEAPAYQVHATLADNLKNGPASRFGLKPMAAGGKSGTAYNFTDALFAGYNSEVTCVVWTGFDKPSPIYRGAFGSQLALPVWAKMMNAASDDLPVREISKPGNLKKVEICERSGDLATDQCYETINGERRRTTFMTYVTAAEMPKRSCPVHTGAGRSAEGLLAILRTSAPTEIPAAAGNNAPRAKPVVNLDNVKAVPVRSPVVVDSANEKDPYDALEPVIAPGGDFPAKGSVPDVANGSPLAAEPVPEKEVRGAQHVQPSEQEVTNALPVRVDPPDTLQFN